MRLIGNGNPFIDFEMEGDVDVGPTGVEIEGGKIGFGVDLEEIDDAIDALGRLLGNLFGGGNKTPDPAPAPDGGGGTSGPEGGDSPAPEGDGGTAAPEGEGAPAPAPEGGGEGEQEESRAAGDVKIKVAEQVMLANVAGTGVTGLRVKKPIIVRQRDNKEALILEPGAYKVDADKSTLRMTVTKVKLT